MPRARTKMRARDHLDHFCLSALTVIRILPRRRFRPMDAAGAFSFVVRVEAVVYCFYALQGRPLCAPFLQLLHRPFLC